MEKNKSTSEFDIQPKNSHSSNESTHVHQIVSNNGEVINITNNDIDIRLERKIRFKLDIHTLPLICLLYLFNALNKGNISNAKTDTIQEDLNIVGNQWNIMLSIFYIPFVLFAFPLSLVVKRYNAARVLPILAFIFGSINLLLVSAFNYGGLMAGRFFLGLCESVYLPAIIFYLSTFYRRHELAGRLAIIYSFSSIANAFSGLLAFGCFQINNPHLKGWQILFMLEGFLTLLIATCAFIFLPRNIQSAKFFNEEERKYAILRVETDSSAASGDSFDFKDAIKVFKHPVTILWLIQELFLGVPLNSINNFFPSIVLALTKTTVEANLYTVAPNVWGAVILIAFAFTSDYFRVRSIVLLVAIASTMIGFIIYGAIDITKHVGVGYFTCFLMTTGAAASSVLTSTWYNNNTPNEHRRIALSAVGIPLANAAGLISANIFRPQDAPHYVPAIGITAGFGGVAIIFVSIIGIVMVFDNRRRNKAQGVNLTYKDVPTSDLSEGPSNPNFRWMY